MSWESSIKGFKSYLQIERSLSDNSVNAYISDIKKLATYSTRLLITELQINKENISDFLSEIKAKGISARSQARIISSIKMEVSSIYKLLFDRIRCFLILHL